MLGIQIQGEFLDLAPGAQLELEEKNPFLQFDNNVTGDYSLPFTAIANEKNLRLLKYAAIPQMQVDTAGVEALIYDNSTQIKGGKVKIEKSAMNLNKISKGVISCYFLTGTAGFWQDIKDVKLRDIPVGGDRSFAWAGLSTITDGFWKHIHQVAAAAPNSYDYAIYPVINQGWATEDVYPPMMNLMYYDIAQTFPMRFPNTYSGGANWERARIVPFPYLHYVLKKIFEEIGWKLYGDILSDADFIKITMINFHAINWCQFIRSGGSGSQVPQNPVIFNLQEHLPDITIASLLVALKNRFGLWYDIDNTGKKVTIKTLQSLVIGVAVDRTAQSSPLLDRSVLQETPIYALRNNFAVSMDGAPNFKVVLLQAAVDKVTDLPTAAEARYAHVHLVQTENNYYICQQNDAEAWVWVLYAYNVYDYEPDGSNNDITTDATTTGNEYHNAYLDFVPRIDNQGEWVGRTEEEASWGIHLAFFFGARNNKANEPFPFASHHIYDSKGVQVGNWSLAFKGEKTDGTQVGLYDLNWKAFLEMLSSNEEFDLTLYLPPHEYQQLQFSDRIVIDGVLLFIKDKKSVIPYNGQVKCTAIRV